MLAPDVYQIAHKQAREYFEQAKNNKISSKVVVVDCACVYEEVTEDNEENVLNLNVHKTRRRRHKKKSKTKKGTQDLWGKHGTVI